MTSMDELKSRAKKISARLKKWAPDADCSLEHHTPIELLVATILSAQCTDERVNIVTESLFKKYCTAEAFATVSQKELEKEIFSTGFYSAKAKNIRESCRIISDKYDGKVPNTIEELTALPGVGRKTANVVLGNAFGIVEGIVVDTHVKRLSGRLGLSDETDPGKIEQDLVKLFPKKQWVIISHQLIRLGRKFCMARKPNCPECPLKDICPKRI